MGVNPYPMSEEPKVVQHGGSKRITIPPGVIAALELEEGERPSEIMYSEDGREVRFRFAEE